MPSERPQFNVRMNGETAARVEKLLPLMARLMGIELTQAQFFALAVQALEEKYARQAVKPPESGVYRLSAPARDKGKK